MASIGTAKTALSEHLVADRCPHCNEMSEMELTINQKVFFIVFPFFPVGKSANLSCKNCESNVLITDASPSVYNKYKTALANSKYKKWSYAGTVVLVVALIFASIATSIDNKKMTAQIEAPEIGDLYTFGTGDEHALINTAKYSIYKIVAIDGDKITFDQSIYEVKKFENVYKLRDKIDDDFWVGDLTTYTKQQLLEMIKFESELRVREIKREETEE